MESPILDYLLDRSNKRQAKLGLESERLVYQSGKRQFYSERIEKIFKELEATKGWKVINSFEGHPLALEKDGDGISLEPGAQLEVSSGPQDSLLDVRKKEEEIQDQILNCESAKDCEWFWTGLDPVSRWEEVEIIPYPRYRIMSDYFPSRGGRGREMMRLTTGFHLNLDFFTESEGLQLLRVCHYLVPTLVATFSNSSFYHSGRSKWPGERTAIWMDTDPWRSGFIPFAFDSKISFLDYVNLVETTPLMFYKDQNGKTLAAEGRCFRDLSPELRKQNALSAMGQLFFEARLKPCCVELRCFDQMKPEWRYAALALAVGLAYDPDNREMLDAQAMGSSIEEHKKLYQLAAERGLENEIFYEQLKSWVGLAADALAKRGKGEERLLEGIDYFLREKKNPAQLALAEKTV